MKKLNTLVNKLKDSLLNNKEIDEMTIIELESLGFKVYPPNHYPKS